MALGSKNITTTLVGTYIGSSSHRVSALVKMTGLNKYSYYAPGQLSVDVNKNIVLTPPSDHFKLGDYRLYDKDALKPSVWIPSGSLNWGPGGATCSFVMNYSLGALNLYAFSDPGYYVTMDFYASQANRSAGGYLKHRQTFAIPTISDTPLIKHTRQSPRKPGTTGWIQCTITGFDTSWLSGPTTVYVDTYITDLAQNRKINFGIDVSDGYSTIVLDQNVAPYLYGWNTNVPTPPSGYTVIFPQVSASGSPICSYAENLEQSFGTTYSFYLVAKGIYNSSARIVAVDSVDIILTLDGVRTVIASGVALSHASGRYCSGTLAGGGTWNYGKAGAITFENGTIQSVPAYTQC